MKRYSVSVNDELLAAIDAFAARHQWSRDKASAELLWRALRNEVRREARRSRDSERITPLQKDPK